MAKLNKFNSAHSGLGGFLNSIQTLFVGALRVWSIPIVLMLSIASGFTTYYGLSFFITPWIGLVITIAIQSIIVICSLEIAGMHWQANRFRYLSVVVSLLVAISASITFSYFKFYEVSESDTLQINRINETRASINDYLGQLLAVKSTLLKTQAAELNKARIDMGQAYFGTHAEVPPALKNVVGEGPFWKHYNERYQDKKEQFAQMENEFKKLDASIQALHSNLNQLELNPEVQYRQIIDNLQTVEMQFNHVATNAGLKVPQPLFLMTYAQFSQGVTPSFAMWRNFSLFAFLCAAMVDFFTFLLSYRLESTAPGPLSEEEQELAFECLRQFSDYKINQNDELEIIIEKTDLERARRYSDWSRMFAVGFLLSRGFLRKIDKRTVAFAPNLYPLIAQKMSAKIRAFKYASTARNELK